MSRFVWILVVMGVILALGEARPRRLPLKDNNFKPRIEHPRGRNNFNDFQDDAFYYPDQELFQDKDSTQTNNDNRNNIDSFSGWYGDSDDEDSAIMNNKISNMIHTMPRDPAYDQYRFGKKPIREYGPDDAIHDVSMFPSQMDNNKKYHVLEEEHFGNEINDIDKIDELKWRMEEMQREMRQMRDMLALEYHTQSRSHLRGTHRGRGRK